jgi:hypothetical protein
VKHLTCQAGARKGGSRKDRRAVLSEKNQLGQKAFDGFVRDSVFCEFDHFAQINVAEKAVLLQKVLELAVRGQLIARSGKWIST